MNPRQRRCFGSGADVGAALGRRATHLAPVLPSQAVLAGFVVLATILHAGPTGAKPGRGRAVPAARAADNTAPEDQSDVRPDARKEAGAYFKRGVAFFKEANFQAALTQFRGAYELMPSYEVLFNLALCERRLFFYGRAMRTLTQYLMEGGARIPPDRRDAVAREVEGIRALTSPVAVIVEGGPATVLVDEEPVGQTPLSELLLLGIGKHKVRAEREGCSPDERVIEVRSGQAQSVQLAPASLTEPVPVELACGTPGTLLSADGAAPVSCPATLALPPGSHELIATAPGFVSARTDVLVEPGRARRITIAELTLRPRPFPTLGVSLLGGGVALGGTGLALALLASGSAARTGTTIRAGGPWDAAAIANEQAGARYSQLAWVFLGVGAGALSAGIVALIVQLTGAPAPGVTLLPAPGGLVACGTF